MTEQERFSINVAEIDLIDSDGKNIEQWPHSFLCLVSETQEVFDQGKITHDNIVRQLHFAPQHDGRATIGDEVDMSIRNRFGRTELFPILGGQASGILPVWNHLFSYSEDLVTQNDIRFGTNPRFGEKDMNCRKLVDAALRSIGFKLYAEFTKSSAGLEAIDIFQGTAYDPGLKYPVRAW